MDQRPSPLGLVLAAWGTLGVLALLGRALWTLTPKAVDAVAMGLSWWQWAILAAWVGFMAYSEGYRGFQKKFSPLVGARALALARRPTWLTGLLAPAFVMGLFAATRRRLAVSWGVLLGVVGLVLLVRLLPQPWRGIVDAGVVVGLAWGGLTVLLHVVRALWTGRPAIDPALPPTWEAMPAAALDRAAK